MTRDEKAAAVDRIAKRILGVETMETRNSDRDDFYDLAIWKIQDAMNRAYDAGRESRDNVPPRPRTDTPMEAAYVDGIAKVIHSLSQTQDVYANLATQGLPHIGAEFNWHTVDKLSKMLDELTRIRAIASRLMPDLGENVDELLASLGFEKTDTGGGCMAWHLGLGGGVQVLVTGVSDAQLPQPYADAVALGVYDDGEPTRLSNVRVSDLRGTVTKIKGGAS